MHVARVLGMFFVGLPLAACGGGGGGGSTGDVASITFPVPSWIRSANREPALATNINFGSSLSVASAVFFDDGRIYLNMQDGSRLTISSADIVPSMSDPDNRYYFFEANRSVNPGNVPDYVEIEVIADSLDNDIIALIRADEFDTPLGFETTMVVGDATNPSSIGTGTASYSGFVSGSLLYNGQLPNFDGVNGLDEEYDFVLGSASVDADFSTGDVSVGFSGFSVPDPSGPGRITLHGSLAGTGTVVPGSSQYTGLLSGSITAAGTLIDLPGGNFIGGFFGAVDASDNPDATAGTVRASEDVLGLEKYQFIGGFVAN